MSQNDAQQLLSSLKNEIQLLRTDCSKGKRYVFPSKMWEKVKKLAEYYPRKDLCKQLMLSSSQISTALGRINKSPMKIKKTANVSAQAPKFVEVLQSNAAYERGWRGKVILECKTSGGLTITVFE